MPMHLASSNIPDLAGKSVTMPIRLPNSILPGSAAAFVQLKNANNTMIAKSSF